jgi:hypothetical protein
MVRYFIAAKLRALTAGVLVGLLISGFSLTSFAIEVDEQIINRSQWPKYFNGSSVSTMPQVQRILQQFEETDRFNIVIQYPGGDSGIAWARQVYQWFIAYGVPGKYLGMELGSGAADQLRLVLINKN